MLSNIKITEYLLSLINILKTKAKTVKEKNGSEIEKMEIFLEHLRESTNKNKTNKRT